MSDEKRVLGTGAAGDVEAPQVAPEGSTPLAPIGEIGVTDTTIPAAPAPAPAAPYEGEH